MSNETQLNQEGPRLVARGLQYSVSVESGSGLLAAICPSPRLTDDIISDAAFTIDQSRYAFQSWMPLHVRGRGKKGPKSLFPPIQSKAAVSNRHHSVGKGR